jgi:hypothetical protein
MNNPPTALVGFQTRAQCLLRRPIMNDPPTALVGFDPEYSCVIDFFISLLGRQLYDYISAATKMFPFTCDSEPLLA